MPDSFTCPRCGLTSHNPTDVKEQYCGNCHRYFGYTTVTYTRAQDDAVYHLIHAAREIKAIKTGKSTRQMKRAVEDLLKALEEIDATHHR